MPEVVPFPLNAKNIELESVNLLFVLNCVS